MTGGQIIFMVIFSYVVCGFTTAGIYWEEVDKDNDVVMTFGIGLVWPVVVLFVGYLAIIKVITEAKKILKEM